MLFKEGEKKKRKVSFWVLAKLSARKPLGNLAQVAAQSRGRVWVEAHPEWLNEEIMARLREPVCVYISLAVARFLRASGKPRNDALQIHCC